MKKLMFFENGVNKFVQHLLKTHNQKKNYKIALFT